MSAGIKVTMVGGEVFTAHKTGEDGSWNGEPVEIYEVRQADGTVLTPGIERVRGDSPTVVPWLYNLTDYRGSAGSLEQAVAMVARPRKPRSARAIAAVEPWESVPDREPLSAVAGLVPDCTFFPEDAAPTVRVHLASGWDLVVTDWDLVDPDQVFLVGVYEPGAWEDAQDPAYTREFRTASSAAAFVNEKARELR